MAADLRTKLLPFTIQNARAKRFYREHWAGHNVDAVVDLASLSAIPTLSKEQYRSGFMLDFDDAGDSHFVSHSTGTTGLLTWRHRSLTEAAVVSELLGAATQMPRPGAAPRVALVLTAQFHGMPFPIPGGQLAIPGATYGDRELSHCVEMLQMTYRVHGHRIRPSVVMGTAEDTSLLVQALHDHDVDTLGLGIEAVFASGYVDPGMRQFIESAFGAPIIGRFSLSEILGSATYDADLDAYRLDPYVIGEVVDEAGRQLPPGGVGELTLTELFPLVQMQPMIRYRTGDIVERVGPQDDMAFSWWGRRNQSVATRSGDDLRWRFGFRHVADILARHPSVDRHSIRPGLETVRTTKVGNLRFEVVPQNDGEDLGLDVTVWLRHVPELHPDSTQQIAESLESALSEFVGAEAPLKMRLHFEYAGGPD